MDRDDLRPCRWCGKPCDGDVCDSWCERQLELEDEAAEEDLDYEDEVDEEWTAEDEDYFRYGSRWPGQ